MNYIPLIVKTNYSLLSSLIDISKLIKKCIDYNITTVAITDSNMYGVMEFYKECKKNNINPLVGLEVTLNNYQLYLYAMNYQGYQNLTRLVYIMQEKELDIDILKQYNSNLICILPYNSSHYYQEFKSIYNHLYLSYTNIKERDILKEISNKLVYANEVLYLDKKDQTYLKYMYLIRDSKKEEDLNSYSINDNSYLLSNEEVLKLSYDEDIKNMIEINNLCHVEISNNNLLPSYSDDKDFDAYTYLSALCKKGLSKRLNNKIPSNYIGRLKHELFIINKMGFCNYFLVVWDFIKYARKNGILTNCRGSAAGSLVSYCLGITDIDPITYNLLFERFLNPERITMPDIDIDFDSERRNEVVTYVINKYGKLRAMPIITFVTLGARQVIRDIGRILNIDTNILDQISKMISYNASLIDSINNNRDLKELINDNKDLKKLYSIACNLEGLKRQLSVHAAGVVISNALLDSYIPIQKYDNYYITGLSMEHLEELGLLKMDFLSLIMLNTIDNLVKEIRKNEPDFNLNNIPLNDSKTLNLFSTGCTDGIFQFESAGMKRFIKNLKPDNFEELVAANALFRPGPMDNIDSYINRKYGKEKIDYIHDDLINILKPTYGIIVYQEQIMQIANIMAGYSLGEADVLRRAMSKKKKDVLEGEKSKFVERSINKGYSEDIANKVYDLILKFANYGFNRAHSVSYALIGYRTAYLKTHYSNYFMSSLLTSVIGNETKTKNYIKECQLLNIKVLKPDINISEYNYKVDDFGVRFSLATIKGVGGITCKEIMKARENKAFVDFFDFVGRTYGKAVTRKSIEALIDANCFSSFGYNHHTLNYNLPLAINYADLVKNLDASLVEKPVMEIVEEYDKEELSKRELDTFGFYLSNHPVVQYKSNYKDLTLSSEITNKFDKIIEMVIHVDRIKEVNTKSSEKMLFIDGSDEAGSVNIVLFPSIYSKYQNINKSHILYVKGRVEKRMSRYQLVASKIDILS